MLLLMTRAMGSKDCTLQRINEFLTYRLPVLELDRASSIKHMERVKE